MPGSTIIADVVLLVAVGINVYSTVKTIRLSRKLRRLGSDMTRDFIQAMTEVETIVCPWCNAAQSDMRVVAHPTPDTNYEITVEEELDGLHECFPAFLDGTHQIPCNAAPIRAAARRAIADSIGCDTENWKSTENYKQPESRT